jgi:hypothetical protein
MCNLNISSQVFRIFLGLLMILPAWSGPQPLTLNAEMINFISFGWLGLIPLLSGITAFCPIYAIFGFHHPQQ